VVAFDCQVWPMDIIGIHGAGVALCGVCVVWMGRVEAHVAGCVFTCSRRGCDGINEIERHGVVMDYVLGFGVGLVFNSFVILKAVRDRGSHSN
jgi:hypothetical protein